MKRILFFVIVAAIPLFAQVGYQDTLSHYTKTTWTRNFFEQYSEITGTVENVGTNAVTLSIEEGKIYSAGNDTMWTIPPMVDSSWTVVTSLVVGVGYTPNFTILRSGVELLRLSYSSSAGDSLIFSVAGVKK